MIIPNIWENIKNPIPPTRTGWWFEPLWKILVNWDDYSQYMGKYKEPNSTSQNWLVVWTTLKNISQLGWLFPIYGKIKNVPNHQPEKIEETPISNGSSLFLIPACWICLHALSVNLPLKRTNHWSESDSQPKAHGERHHKSPKNSVLGLTFWPISKGAYTG